MHQNNKSKFRDGNMIVYDYITEYIRSTINKDAGILEDLQVYAKLNDVPIIRPETAKFLLVLGRIVRPERILEVGTAIGYSSILLSKTLKPGGTIDTIDSYDSMIETARKNIKAAELQGTINTILGDAMEVLACLDKPYNLIFLDAAKGQYPGLLPECLRLLVPGGVLVSDNVLYKGMVADDSLVVRRKKTIVKRLRKYLDQICKDKNLDTCILPIGDGVSVSIKKS